MLDSFINECSKRSQVTERVFLNLFVNCGFNARLSTNEEQRVNHIDVWLTDIHGKIWRKGDSISVDVKDQKWTGFDIWEKNANGKMVKTGKRRTPLNFSKDEPCCSYEYKKFGYKGNTVCDKQPDYFAFESVEEGTTKYKDFEIGNSFYLIESCIVKADALKLKDKYGYRDPKAIKKRDMRDYYQYLVQYNERGDNYYIHVPMKHIRKLPHLYLRVA